MIHSLPPASRLPTSVLIHR